MRDTLVVMCNYAAHVERVQNCKMSLRAASCWEDVWRVQMSCPGRPTVDELMDTRVYVSEFRVRVHQQSFSFYR